MWPSMSPFSCTSMSSRAATRQNYCTRNRIHVCTHACTRHSWDAMGIGTKITGNYKVDAADNVWSRKECKEARTGENRIVILKYSNCCTIEQHMNGLCVRTSLAPKQMKLSHASFGGNTNWKLDAFEVRTMLTESHQVVTRLRQDRILSRSLTGNSELQIKFGPTIEKLLFAVRKKRKKRREKTIASAATV